MTSFNNGLKVNVIKGASAEAITSATISCLSSKSIATEKATEASVSASSAEASASTATAQAVISTTKATEASVSASSAEASASTASLKANEASSSASSALTSKMDAATSEENALSYKNSASVSAATATNKASEASDSVDVALAYQYGAESAYNSTLSLVNNLVLPSVTHTVDTVDDFGTIPNGIYTVIVKDINRGGIFIYDATQSAVNNGGTVFDGWVRQYSGAVNVRWFGAVPNVNTVNQATANSVAIQRALDNFIDVVIDEHYYIYTGLVLRNNGRIKGVENKANTPQLEACDNRTLTTALLTIEALSYHTSVSGIGFVGNWEGQPDSGAPYAFTHRFPLLQLGENETTEGRSVYAHIQNCYFASCNGEGIKVLNGESYDIDNCFIRDCFIADVDLNKSYYGTFTNSIIRSSKAGGVGLLINSTKNNRLRVSGLTFADNHIALKIDGSGTATRISLNDISIFGSNQTGAEEIYINGTKGLTINSLYMEMYDPGENQITINNSDVSISNLRVVGPSPSDAGTNLFNITSSCNMILNNFDIYGYEQSWVQNGGTLIVSNGVLEASGSGFYLTNIEANITNIRFKEIATYPLRANNASYLLVDGNIFKDCCTTAGQRYCIQTDTNLIKAVITDNIFLSASAYRCVHANINDVILIGNMMKGSYTNLPYTVGTNAVASSNII